MPVRDVINPESHSVLLTSTSSYLLSSVHTLSKSWKVVTGISYEASAYTVAQSAENPCGTVDEYKQVVLSMVQALYTTPSRTFTVEVLMPFESDLTSVMIGLLNTPEGCMPSKDIVLDNVGQARDEMGLAIQKIVDLGSTREFNKCLRNCRRYLEDALRDWED